MKTSNGPNTPRNNNGTTNHPPLAHDAQGHPIAMPDGAAWWMVKRHTTGRPKVILGTDSRPLRFSLDATAEQIADMCGPGTYRLDALDALGNPIDHVTTVEIGGEDDEDDTDERDPVLASARSSGGDLRFALETIMQMARAQSDSLRAVSEAQADWVKGLAHAKALPRNAIAVPPPPMPLAAGANEHDDDDEPSAPPSLPPYAVIAQAAQGIVHDLPSVIQAFTSIANLRNAAARASTTAPAAGAYAATSATSPGDPRPFHAPNAMVHLTEINERLDRTERRYLRHGLRHANADALTEELLSRPVEEAVAFVREQIARARAAQAAPANDQAPTSPQAPGAPPVPPPDFMTQVYAVGALLSAKERNQVLALLPRLPPQRLAQLQSQLVAMTPADAAAWIRENLASLSAEVAA